MPQAALAAALIAALAILQPCVQAGSVAYRIDPGWPSGMPAGAGTFSAMAVEQSKGSDGRVRTYIAAAQRSLLYDAPVILFDVNGTAVGEFGNGSVAHNQNGWGVHGLTFQPMSAQDGDFWLTDVQDFTLKRFSSSGRLRSVTGTQGVAGSGTDPLQFGNVADVAWSDDGRVFVADGDGGVNNRVVAFRSADDASAGKPMWITGNKNGDEGKSSKHSRSRSSSSRRRSTGADDTNVDSSAGFSFNQPHCLAYHEPTNTVFVGDRGNNRTVQLDADTGAVLGQWVAPLSSRTPWGLRILRKDNAMVMVDGPAQELLVLNLDGVTPSDPGPYSLASVLALPRCDTPHELAVDQLSGDVYVACIASTATALRLVQTSR